MIDSDIIDIIVYINNTIVIYCKDAIYTSGILIVEPHLKSKFCEAVERRMPEKVSDKMWGIPHMMLENKPIFLTAITLEKLIEDFI